MSRLHGLYYWSHRDAMVYITGGEGGGFFNGILLEDVPRVIPFTEQNIKLCLVRVW